jgi:pilus assembly protein Flp/PilA
MLLLVSTWLASFCRDEEGQGLVEYGLIIVIVSIAAIGALALLAGSINGLFDTIAGTLGG